MQEPSASASTVVPSMFGSLGPPVASGNALPVGTRLDEFELTAVVGEGGFGIVYKAWDHTLQREVAIKEFFPSTLAFRSQVGGQAGAQTVQVLNDADTFVAGLRSFVNEAKLLARFDHPSLLKVYRFWEANGTAYMVMPFYEGRTLKRTLIDLGGAPDEAWLRRLLRRLIDALEPMHGAQCYHRDIAPDNILVLPDGRPMLLDFGAARRVLGDKTQALTVILKPGFAPVEQYSDTADLPDMRQGPWTDLYALGAVLHFAVTGAKPPAAVARILNDHYRPLVERRLEDAHLARYGVAFLHAVDRMLAVRPRDRPQNVAELRALLGRGDDATASAPAPLDSVAVQVAPAAAAAAQPVLPPLPDIVIDDPVAPWLTPAPKATLAPEPTLAPEVTLAPVWTPPPSGFALEPTPGLAVEPAAEPAIELAPAQTPAQTPTLAPLPTPADPGIANAAASPSAGPTRSWRWAAVAVPVAGVALALVGYWRAGSPPAGPAPRASAVPAPAPVPVPVPVPVAPPAPVAVAPVAVPPPAPEASAAAATVVAPPVPLPAAPAVAAVAPEPAPARPAPKPRARPVAPPPQATTYAPTPSPPPRVAGQRCQDILQRVSLGEDLTAADRGYLRTECGR